MLTTLLLLPLTRYVFPRQVRSFPFQVVMRRFTLLIIPSRHEYLADNDTSFVLYVYSTLKLACQGLTKSQTHTAAHLCSVFKIFTSVMAGYLVLHFNITPLQEMYD